MENRVRLLVFGLIGLFIISMGFSFYLFNSKEALQKEYLSTKDSLSKENEELARRANAALQEKRNIESRFEDLKMQMNRITNERQEIQSRYDLLVKEKDELVEKLKQKPTVITQTVPAYPSTPTPSAPSTPEAGDNYWAGILMQKKNLEMELETASDQLRALKMADEQAQREKNILQLEINNLNRENQDLKRKFEFKQKEIDSKLELNQKMMDSLGAELVREKNDKFKIQETVAPLKDENSLLRRQLKMLNGRKVKIENKLTELELKNSSLERKISEMDVFVKEKNLAIDSMQKQMDEKALAVAKDKVVPTAEPVELPPIIVRPPTEAPGQVNRPLIGKVLAVNRDSNFIVVDLGADSGIKVGDTFSVYRDDRAIANVQVIQNRKSISACDIKKATAAIRVGDVVK